MASMWEQEHQLNHAKRGLMIPEEVKFVKSLPPDANSYDGPILLFEADTEQRQKYFIYYGEIRSTGQDLWMEFYPRTYKSGKETIQTLFRRSLGHSRKVSNINQMELDGDIRYSRFTDQAFHAKSLSHLQATSKRRLMVVYCFRRICPTLIHLMEQVHVNWKELVMSQSAIFVDFASRPAAVRSKRSLSEIMETQSWRNSESTGKTHRTAAEFTRSKTIARPVATGPLRMGENEEYVFAARSRSEQVDYNTSQARFSRFSEERLSPELAVDSFWNFRRGLEHFATAYHRRHETEAATHDSQKTKDENIAVTLASSPEALEQIEYQDKVFTDVGNAFKAQTEAIKSRNTALANKEELETKCHAAKASLEELQRQLSEANKQYHTATEDLARVTAETKRLMEGTQQHLAEELQHMKEDAL